MGPLMPMLPTPAPSAAGGGGLSPLGGNGVFLDHIRQVGEQFLRKSGVAYEDRYLD